MPNDYFRFKQFTVNQDRTAMKVGIDSVILGAWVCTDNTANVLDVGTGTGLLALMLAQRVPYAQVDAVEIDADAYMQASDNVATCKWADRINVFHADYLCFNLPPNRSGYDLVVSNPPYFVDSLKSPDKQRTAARHCYSLPHRHLVSRSLSLLNPQGRLALILPVSEFALFEQLALEYGLYCIRKLNVKARHDKAVHRVVSEWTLEHVVKMDEQDLCVEIERHKYTEQYKILTKEFYLAH